MAKRKKKLTAEERAERERGFEESQRFLHERIEYHRARREKEERARRREAS